MATKTAVEKVKTITPTTTALDSMMADDAGAGISNRPEDNQIPNIKVLQPLSPQVLDGPGKMPGATAGDFILAGSTTLPGSQGIWFQPVAWAQEWREFLNRERGGGYVASYPVNGFDDALQPIPPAGVKQVAPYQWVFTDSGNVCIHYRNAVGILWQRRFGLEYVIPFTSTGHSVMKAWNTKAGQKRFAEGPKAGMQHPLFAYLYHLTASQRRNKKGQWYVIDVGPAVPLDSDELKDVISEDWHHAYAIGKKLHLAFEKGEKKLAVDADDQQQQEDVM